MAGIKCLIVSCCILLIFGANAVHAAKTETAPKSQGRLAFMKLPGSSSYIPIFVNDQETASAQTSYSYKPPEDGYSYPKPPTKDGYSYPKPPAKEGYVYPKPPSRLPPIPEFPTPDEEEDQIDAAGVPGVTPGREAEQTTKAPAIGLEDEEDVDSAGHEPDKFPPGVYDEPQFEDCHPTSLDCIPGTPGVDYPTYSDVPKTNFRCPSMSGYYGDAQARCQSFHVCLKKHAKVLQYSFLCPNGTVFSQNDFICVWWHEFKCENTPTLYHLNRYLHWDDARVSLKQKIGYLKRMTKRQPANGGINPLNFPQQLLPALSIRLPDSRQTYGLLQPTLPPVSKTSVSKTVSSQYQSQSQGYEDNHDAHGFIVNTGYSRSTPQPWNPWDEKPTSVTLGSSEEEEDIQPGGSYPTQAPRRPRPPPKQPQGYPDEDESEVQPGGSYPTHPPPSNYPRPRPKVTQPPRKYQAELPAPEEDESEVQPGGSFPTTTPAPPKYRPKPITPKPFIPPQPAASMDEDESEVQPGGSIPTMPTPKTKPRPRITLPPTTYLPPTPKYRPSSTTKKPDIGFTVPDEDEEDVQAGGFTTTTAPTKVTRKPKPSLTYLPPSEAPPPPQQGYSDYRPPPVQYREPIYQQNYVTGYVEPQLSYSVPLSSPDQSYYPKPAQVPANQYDGVAIFLPRDSNVIPARSPIGTLQKDFLQNGVIPALGPIEPVRAISYSFPPAPIPISVGQQQQLIQAQARYQEQLQTDSNFEPYQVRYQRQSKPVAQQQIRKQDLRSARQSTVRQSQQVPKRQAVRRSQKASDPLDAQGASMSFSVMKNPFENRIEASPMRIQSRQSNDLDTQTRPPRQSSRPRKTSSRMPEGISALDFLDSNDVIDDEPQPASQVLPIALVTPAPTPSHIPVSNERFQEPVFDNTDSNGRIPVVLSERLRDILLPEELDGPPELVRSREVFAQTFISREDPNPRAVAAPISKHHSPPPKPQKLHFTVVNRPNPKYVKPRPIAVAKPRPRPSTTIPDHYPRHGKRNRFWLDLTKY